MRRFLVALAGLACTGSAFAQLKTSLGAYRGAYGAVLWGLANR